MDITDEILGIALENKWLRIFIASYSSLNLIIIALLIIIVFRLEKKCAR